MTKAEPNLPSASAPPASALWRRRPVLVTGATGLVGSWLTRRLVDLGAEVVALVRDWVPESELFQGEPGRRSADRVRIVRGDLLDLGLLERVLGEHEIDTVFHLAAQTIVGIANRNPLSTWESNVRGTWNLLEACRRSPKVRAVVVASSDKAYGEAAHLPYDETTPLAGVHPYDASKSCADIVTQSYARSFGVPAVITRCGNFFGGGDLNWNRIVPGTVRSLLAGERPEIRSDGSYVRDYFYVEDGAAAYTHLAEQLLARPELAGQAFNFSNEEPLSVLEVVARIQNAMGTHLEPRIHNHASGEIPRQVLSAAKARRDLDWAPRHSFDAALQPTIAWYRDLLAVRP